MHTQGNHYAAVVFQRVDCSRNQCQSYLSDELGGTERDRERERERERQREREREN
jgi:hypothetical protein